MRHRIRWVAVMFAGLVAGCGGGGGTPPGAAPGPQPSTRLLLTKFDVDVTSGKVTMSEVEDPSGRGRAVMTGKAVSFTSSDLLSMPGDSGKRLIRLRVNDLNNPNEVGSLAGGRLIVENLANSAGSDARGNVLVTTFAGAGSAGGTDGFRTSATFSEPSFFLAGNSDVIYVSDMGNNTIRAIDRQGYVTTLAGVAGGPGFADGQGSAARFYAPAQMVRFSGGSVEGFLVADTGNRRIRYVRLDGTVTTIAGTGAAGNDDGPAASATFGAPTGIAVGYDYSISQNAIFVVDRANNNVRRLQYNTSLPPDQAAAYTVSTRIGPTSGTPGFTNGSSGSARFQAPTSIQYENFGGRFTITDTGNHALRLFDGSVDTLSTIVGNGAPGSDDGPFATARLNQPIAVYMDSGLVTDAHSLRQYSTASSAGSLVTLAGRASGGFKEGSGNEALFSAPAGIMRTTVAGRDTFLVADPGNHRIRTVDIGPGLPHVGGTSTPEPEPVRILNADAEVPNRSAAWMKVLDATEAAEIQFYVPAGVSGFSFTAYVEIDTALINLPSAGASYLTTVAGDGHAGLSDGPGKLAQFNGPYGVAAVPQAVRDFWLNIDNVRAFVADADNHLIRFVNFQGQVGTFAGSVPGYQDGPTTSAQFRRPRGVAIAPDGMTYVADTDNNRIRRITPLGDVSTVAGTGAGGNVDGTGNVATIEAPEGITVDAGRNIFVTSSTGHVVRRIRYVTGDPKLPQAYQVTTVAGLAGAPGTANGTGSAARFRIPVGIAVDTDGRLYVADFGNNAIRVLTRSGPTDMTVTTFIPNAGQPAGITVDTAHNIYYTNTAEGLVRRVSPLGVIANLMGAAGTGFTDGPNGRFNGPRHLALEESGNLLVTDYGNRALRAIHRVIYTAQPPGT